MKTITAIPLTLLVLLLAACSAAPDQSASDSTPEDAVVATQPAPAAQSFELGALSYIFESGGEPIVAAVDLDSDLTVEALIPIEGGSISATGADGTLYTLEIPGDALLNETLIGLTPVSGITGLPFGTEQTYAVQLSPEGLYLQNYAILTIAPAAEIPMGEQIVFGYQGEGSDPILAAPVFDSNEIQIKVLHFSGNGVTKGLLADIEPVRERLGGDAERRLQNAVNEALIRARQDGADAESVAEIFTNAFRQYVEQVIKPRVAAAGESCANGQLALQTVLSFERQVQLLGMSEDDFLAGIDMSSLLQKAAQICVVEEFELCVEDHIIHRMLPVWLGFERQFALLGMPDAGVLNEALELATQCLTFTLNFESTGTADISGGGYESSVTSEITLRFDANTLKISGEAPLVNESYEFTMPNCNTQSTPGGGTFAVFDLIFDYAPGASAEYDSGPEAFGHVVDFKLNYHPGNTTENASITCPNTGTLPMPLPAWTSAFLATHIDEVTEAGWISVDWDLLGGELFAEKEWDLTNAEISEEGSFELHHTPGR